MKTRDPLYRDARSTYKATFPVLGTEVSFESTSQEAIDLVAAQYGSSLSSDLGPDFVTPSPVVVRIIVHDAPSSAGVPLPARYRLPNPTRLVVWNGEAVAIADTDRGESVAYVDRSLLERPPAFVDSVLDPMTLFQLGARDRRPIHGVAIRRGDAALVLAGESGVGKSTVAYAATKFGFEVLGDEPVYVQTEPTLRIWCRDTPLRLDPGAAEYFPELRDVAPTELPSGKRKLLMPSTSPLRYADRIALCMLYRGEGPEPSLDPMEREDIVAALSERIDEGYDIYQSSLPTRLGALAQTGAWRLGVAGTPQQAASLLGAATDAMGTGD